MLQLPPVCALHHHYQGGYPIHHEDVQSTTIYSLIAAAVAEVAAIVAAATEVLTAAAAVLTAGIPAAAVVSTLGGVAEDSCPCTSVQATLQQTPAHATVSW